MTAALVLLGAVKALGAWALLDPRPELVPDTALYAQGGVGLFPSPLGRLVGVGGVPAIVALNVVSNALLVLGCIRLAGSRWAGVVALLAPLGVWSIFAGMDTAAACALVWAASELDRGRVARSAGLGALAVGFHMAAILVVGAFVLQRRSGRLVLVLGAISVALAAATPYRSALLELDPWLVVTGAIATAAVYLLTFAPFVLRLVPALPAIAGGALASGLVAGHPWETNCRYMLPAVAVGAGVSTRRASS